MKNVMKWMLSTVALAGIGLVVACGGEGAPCESSGATACGGAQSHQAPESTQGWFVVPTGGGYLVRSLPAELAASHGSGLVEFSLDDPSRGRTTIVGEARRLTDTDIEIATGDRFTFTDRQPDTAILLKAVVRTASGLKPRSYLLAGPGAQDMMAKCSGCPRDSNLRKWNESATICECH